MTTALGPAGRIGRFFIESKLTPLLVIGALALGFIAVVETPREEEPQIVVPIFDVFVGLPGASPSEVESRITLPLEKRAWEIPGVEYVYSASMPGMALVTVRFTVGADQERSLVKLYEKLVSSLDRKLEDATPPLVRTRTIDDVPVYGLTLSSHVYTSGELRRIAAELAKELSRVQDVSDIRLIGGERRQVRILIDSVRLASVGLDASSLRFALEMQNSAAPSGSYEQANQEILIETGGFLHDAEDVAGLVVGVHEDRPIYMRDVASIVDGSEEVSSYVLLAERRDATQPSETAGPSDRFASAVTLAIAKRKGSDASRVVTALRQKVRDSEGTLIPPDIDLTVTRDYGATASEKANELLLHLFVAIASVTIVIGLFLGWRGALVVFIAVPVSFALTLFIYYIFGYTLNRVTLFALVFVTGIVVDDSIIVVENIVRHLAMKRQSPLQAAITAVNEVGNPTILATLTVIAAVLPMAFVRGLMGPYMRPMPVGAALAMVFSLLVALIAAPWFGYRLLRQDSGESEHDLRRTRVYRVYRRVMQPLLSSPRLSWIFLASVATLLALSVLLFPLRLVTVKMLPFDNKSELQLIIDMPEGTTLETTESVARDLAEASLELPEVTHVQIYAGTAAPINFNGLVRHYDLRQGSNVADVQVNFLHKGDRSSQSHDLARVLRPRIEQIASRHGASVKIAEVPPGPPVLSTLVAEVYGPDDAARLKLAAKVKEIFASTDGVVDVDWLVEAPQTKRVLRIDHEKAARFMVPSMQVARTLRLALTGETVGRLHVETELEPVDLRLELPRAERSTLEDLAGVRVRGLNGALVPLSELVSVEETTLEPTRYRKNLQPVVYVTGDVAGKLESPVYAILDMAEEIDRIELDGDSSIEQNYRHQPFSDDQPSLKWDGEWHITYEVFRDLGLAFGVVLILIYMLIIGWFKSFKVPAVMMISIPLSLVGVIPGHWIFGAFFTATSMIGFNALAGIMVRNAVLLIDFINIALQQGSGLEEAVVEAGAVRFRPILLTAGTVVVGAMVILFDPIFQGLAIALMTGA
ncbi:MAG: efflux RND transporter permease subunit, partial [Acidobacteriota bacterium]